VHADFMRFMARLSLAGGLSDKNQPVPRVPRRVAQLCSLWSVRKLPGAIQFAQKLVEPFHQSEPLTGSQNRDHLLDELLELARLILVNRRAHVYSPNSG